MKKDHSLNILVLHNRYRQRGGEDTAVENEIRLLKQHGHHVYLYERDNSEGFLPLSVFFSLRSYHDVKQLIRKHHIDIVHVHNTWMAMSPSVLYAAAGMKVPVAQTLHNFRMICPNAILYRNGSVCEECPDKGMLHAVKNRCYRGSRVFSLVCALNHSIHRRTGIYRKINFICLSDFNREKILRINRGDKLIIDPAKVMVKPNFIWPNESPGVERSERRGFVFAGRLTEEKGVKVLVNAWILMGDKAPELSIYGNGELKSWCERAIATHGLNISLKGEIDHAELMMEIGKASALIFPSLWYEGAPMTVIEALSAGTPVIAGDMGNGKQFIENNRNGALFRTGSVEDLSRTVMEIADGRLTFDEKDIKIPKICTPEENYGILRSIYDTLLKF